MSPEQFLCEEHEFFFSEPIKLIVSGTLYTKNHQTARFGDHLGALGTLSGEIPQSMPQSLLHFIFSVVGQNRCEFSRDSQHHESNCDHNT